MTQPIGRAEFVKRLSGLSVLLLLDRSVIASAISDSLRHPEPRPGITADKVLKAADLGEKPRKGVLEAYEVARENPQIFDGLACACGCSGDASYQHRSLLVCFETRQPTGCHGCREVAEFVGRMTKDGKALAEIRVAVDKKFG